MTYTIDISQVVYETGVSVYTRELVRALIPQLQNQETLKLFAGALRRRADLMKFISELDYGEYTLIPLSPNMMSILFHKFNLSIDIFSRSNDLFHSSDWTEPRSTAIKVTTIHDFAPFKFPEQTSQVIQKAHSEKLQRIKRYVDAVIVPSNATKNDAIEWGISEKKLFVIPEAPSIDFSSENKENTVSNIYNLPERYVLMVGTSERKNLKRAISAFKMVKSQLELDKLVVIGTKPSNTDTLPVHYLGHVPREHVPSLYRNALMILYPSLYEGFGLPILEGFVSKTPVVTSSVSSMPEVAGDAAVLVDPHSTEDIAEGIKKALNKRDILIKRGEKRVSKYTWEKTALETLRLYRILTNSQ